jgi:hypothetical protein
MIDNNCVLSAEQLDELEGDFWERRSYLKTIWQEAFNSIASPWGVLGDVMVRAQLSVPSDVVLPRIRGGQASTTLYATIVSDSGGGKTSADALASELVPLGDEVKLVRAGSRQALGQACAANDAVLASYDEMTVLLSTLRSTNGDGMDGDLCSAWFGGRLSNDVLNVKNSYSADSHSYKLGMFAGMQLSLAGKVREHQGIGLLQRLLFLPAHEPRRHLCPEDPVYDQVPQLLLPRDNTAVTAVRQRIEVPIEVARTLRKMPDVGGMDSHLGLMQLKVAHSLGVLDGRTLEITMEDWELAGTVMDVHLATRQAVMDSLARQRISHARDLGEMDQIRKNTEDPGTRISRRAAEIIKDAGPEGISLGELRNQKIAHRDRTMFDELGAVDILCSNGLVEVKGHRAYWAGS